MKRYIIKSECINSRTGERLPPGSEIELDEERYQIALKAGVIGKEVESSGSDDGDVEGLKHVGGGYYELPNGEKVRGKEKALEALAALEAGEVNAETETSDTSDDGAGNNEGDQSATQD